MLFRKDQRQATAALLKEAVEWNKSSGIEGAGMATVWRKTAEFHLKTGEAKVAAESLEELQRLEPSLTTLAQLVTAYAKCDLGPETCLWSNQNHVSMFRQGSCCFQEVATLSTSPGS